MGAWETISLIGIIGLVLVGLALVGICDKFYKELGELQQRNAVLEKENELLKNGSGGQEYEPFGKDGQDV